jgi:predicted RNA binding protein YcfA (HicA-like mRNA interferase family)
MPRKIRELAKAGFVDRGGKGSHRNFKHPGGAQITISGGLGQDAKKDQERAVDAAVREVAR